MKVVSLHDKVEIESFLRRDTFLHVYSIGDLDDYFWPHTVWYALQEDGALSEVALLYTGLSLPTLLALSVQPGAQMRALLTQVSRLLPRRFYAHLSDGLSGTLEGDYLIEPHGAHYKMALTNPALLDMVDTTGVVPLSAADLPDLHELYRVSYPDNWFDPRMLGTGQYFGLRRDGKLVGVAGIHVHSQRYRVAALGNVATHPQYRGRGIARAICAELCRSLLRTVDHIGLNVKADNVAAIRAYEGLGFERIATYDECSLTPRGGH